MNDTVRRSLARVRLLRGRLDVIRVLAAILFSAALVLPADSGVLGRAGQSLVRLAGSAVFAVVPYLLLRVVCRFTLSLSTFIWITSAWVYFVEAIRPVPRPAAGWLVSEPLTFVFADAALLFGLAVLIIVARFLARKPAVTQSVPAAPRAPVDDFNHVQQDVLSALGNLGYSRKPAERAIRAAEASDDFAALLKDSLTRLSS